jgi:hypothetical protein
MMHDKKFNTSANFWICAMEWLIKKNCYDRHVRPSDGLIIHQCHYQDIDTGKDRYINVSEARVGKRRILSIIDLKILEKE